MEKEDLELRIKDAIVLLDDRRPINVGDLTFGSKNKNHLSVTGWTRTNDLETISKVSALKELNEIKDLFKRMTFASKVLSDFIGNKEIEFHLGYDYRMGAIVATAHLAHLHAALSIATTKASKRANSYHRKRMEMMQKVMRQLRISIMLLCFGLMILFTGDVLGQLSSVQMKKDVLELRKGLEKNHPGLYWYTSKDQFDSIWQRLDTQINNSMTDQEFLKLLLPVVASVKCSHTLFYPSKEIMSRGTRFPLTLDFIQGRAYILGHSGQNDIPEGSELLTINGMTLDKIIDLILPALQAQGSNLGWKYVILENDFQNYYYYIVEQTEKFVIEYNDPTTNQKIKKELKGISDQSIRTHWSKWYPVEVGAPMSISFPNSNEVAILTIRSLSKGRYKMYQQDFEATLTKYFKEIKEKEIKNLIIDLRGNEGGNNPELIYSYILKRGDRNVKGSADYIKPAKEIFQGPVVVLMNERSISSQETFVAIFKNNDRGPTVGRHTSGSYNGLSGGNKRKIVLPNSRFEINIPLHAESWTHKKVRNYQEGQGFPPDIEVDESIDDTLAGKDAVMQVALERISKL